MYTLSMSGVYIAHVRCVYCAHQVSLQARPSQHNELKRFLGLRKQRIMCHLDFGLEARDVDRAADFWPPALLDQLLLLFHFLYAKRQSDVTSL